MSNKQKKFAKFIGIQVVVIIATLATQMVMVFFQQNKILVIQPKDDQKTFYGLYVSAKADSISCEQQLEQVKAEKQQAIEANNQDILGE